MCGECLVKRAISVFDSVFLQAQLKKALTSLYFYLRGLFTLAAYLLVSILNTVCGVETKNNTLHRHYVWLL